MNDVARRFLEAYARGGEIEGGWKFARALQQAHLFLPLAWWNAARVLAVAASTLMSVVAEGRAALPQIGWQHARGRRVNSLTLSYDGPDAVARGKAALAENRDDAAGAPSRTTPGSTFRARACGRSRPPCRPTVFGQAAAGDFAQAQYEMAMHCGTRDGVPQDDQRAVYWLERAVQNDHGEALILLAGKYERGRGVPPDTTKAVALYRRGADKKIPTPWYHLGVMAADGRGLQQDLREAMRLMRLAAHDGVGDAKGNTSRISSWC